MSTAPYRFVGKRSLRSQSSILLFLISVFIVTIVNICQVESSTHAPSSAAIFAFASIVAKVTPADGISSNNMPPDTMMNQYGSKRIVAPLHGNRDNNNAVMYQHASASSAQFIVSNASLPSTFGEVASQIAAAKEQKLRRREAVVADYYYHDQQTSHKGMPSSASSSSAALSTASLLKDSYLPCLINNGGCVCNHTLPYFNWADGQFYGTCITCTDKAWTGPTCMERNIECQNFGERVNGTCVCPPGFVGPLCEQHLCLHSHGGVGNYSIALPDKQNYCRHCLDGFDGINCDMCTNDNGCDAGSYCSADPMYLFNNHKMLCDITDPKLVDELEWGGRKVAATIALNCSDPYWNWQSTKSGGKCSATLYRQEYINIPSQQYIDPFFFCSLFDCFASQTTEYAVVPNDEERQKVFDAVKYLGMGVLLTLVLIAALSKYIPIAKRFDRLPVTVSLVVLLIAIVAYIGAMEGLMNSRPTELKRTVTMHCKTGSCECADDVRLINDSYAPNCAETAFASLILPSIKGNVDIVCDDSMVCSFQPRDLTLSIPLKCRSSECVPKDFKPSDYKEIVPVETSAFIALGAVVFAILVVSIHYTFSRYRTKKASEEFSRTQLAHGGSGSECGGGSTSTSRVASFSDPNEAGALSAVPAHEAGDDDAAHKDNKQQAPLLNTKETKDALKNKNTTSRHKNSKRYETEQLLGGSATMSPTIGLSSGGINRHTRTFSGEPLASQAFISSGGGGGDDGTGGAGGMKFKALSQCHLTVENLFYKVRCQPWPPFKLTEANSKYILFDLTLTAQSGDVVALMGSSGAGKTTFLDILAARDKMGVVEGEIKLNGSVVSGGGRKSSRKRRTGYRGLVGYVSQEDTLLPHLTVRETLRYAAQLKLPVAFGMDKINEVVEDVIRSLKLERCADTIVGDGHTTRGLSGGEKRRVSIGVELVANPRILFLDEPTSGLDAANALNVMDVVAELARTSPLRAHAPNFFSFNPIIIASIHQPSKAILKRFTKVVLLSRGKMVYSGQVSQSSAAILAQLNPATASRIQDCAEGDDNPAEIMLAVDDHITDEQREALASWTKEGEVAEVGVLQTTREASEMMGRASKNSSVNIIEESAANKKYYMNSYNQFSLLVRRAYASLMGAYYLVAAHGLVAFVMGLLMCLLYQSQPLTLPGTLNRAGSVTFLLLVQSFISLSALEQLMTEKKLFVTEKENGFYTTLPYLVSKVVVDIFPLRIIPSVFVSSLIYFPMGLRMDDGSHFLWFIFIVTLFTCTITMLVVCIGAVSQSFGSAALVASVLILWNFVFGGLLVQSQTIPEGFTPFRNVSPFYFAFEALMINDLKGQLCEFAPTNDAGQQSGIKMTVFCVQYLFNLGLKADRFGIDIACLSAECVAFVGLAYLLMTFVKLTR